MSLDVVRGEVESVGRAHQNIATQMKTELEETLSAFTGGMKERRKIVQGGIEKLLKIKTQQTTTVNKVRHLALIEIQRLTKADARSIRTGLSED